MQTSNPTTQLTTLIRNFAGHTVCVYFANGRRVTGVLQSCRGDALILRTRNGDGVVALSAVTMVIAGEGEDDGE